ncbi:hypothetical protein ACO2XV_06575 [Escherichia coli]
MEKIATRYRQAGVLTTAKKRFTTLEQEQQVKTRTAEQNARIAAFEAERRREAEQTRILAERQIQETEDPPRTGRPLKKG